jgi:hypothetical protein
LNGSQAVFFGYTIKKVVALKLLGGSNLNRFFSFEADIIGTEEDAIKTANNSIRADSSEADLILRHNKKLMRISITGYALKICFPKRHG